MGKPRLFYGYVVATAGFFIQMIAFGIFVTFGIFFNCFLSEFGWARALISGASSAGFFLNGLLSIFVGRLSDKIGPRLVMISCAVFFGLGYFLMSRVNALWQLYLFYGLIIAIGLSSMDVLPLTTIVRWFVRKRGMMSGVVKVGAGMGLLIIPLAASWLITNYGWRIAYIVIGVTSLVVMLSCAQFLRRDPAERGLLPDGDTEADTSQLNSDAGGFSLREAARIRQFWMLCAMYLLITFSVQIVIVHLVQHAIDLGITPVKAASIFAVVGGVSIVGRFIMGSAGDKIGTRLAQVICFSFFSVAFSWLLSARELWMFYLFAALYGFAHGGFFALISPTVADLFGLRAHGAILGTVLFSGTIGGAIGPVLSGYIFDITSSYLIPFSICVALSVTGLVLTLLLKPTAKIAKAGIGSTV